VLNNAQLGLRPKAVFGGQFVATQSPGYPRDFLDLALIFSATFDNVRLGILTAQSTSQGIVSGEILTTR
jgi:hypothetical protein